MPKLIVACCRAHEDRWSEESLKALAKRLIPSGLPAAATVTRRAGLGIVVVGDGAALARHDRPDEQAICLGRMFGPPARWWATGSDVPDETYALVRADPEKVELLSDMVASRSLWYYADDRVLLASSSQRALVALLGSFRLRRSSVEWMLSSGALGPGGAWDERLRLLPADSRLVLRRADWNVEQSSRKAVFQPLGLSAEAQERRLRDALVATCSKLELPSERWRLPLSGGYDSRAMLLMLAANGRSLGTVTWGTSRAVTERNGDATVARELSATVGVPNLYLPIERRGVPWQTVLDNYMEAGEGTIDHINSHLDGFAMWRALQAQGVEGILRGDEGFGWRAVISETDVRQSIGATRLDDFFSEQQLGAFGLGAQAWPRELEREGDETLDGWRDRLYHTYRLPVILGALTDHKVHYVELANPLLSREVLEVVRGTSDELRTDKLLFRRIVEKMSPPVRFATAPAIASQGDLLGEPEVRRILRDGLMSDAAKRALPPTFCQYVVDRYVPSSPPALRGKIIGRMKAAVPPVLKRYLRPIVARPRLSPSELALRAWIVTRMAQTLESDAAVMGTLGPTAEPSR